MTGDLRDVALHLFGLPRGEFVAERNAAAKELREGGLPELAAVVKAWPKPTVLPWSINVTVQRWPELVARLVAISADLRAVGHDPGSQEFKDVEHEYRERLVKIVGAHAVECQQGHVLAPNILPTMAAARASVDAERAAVSGFLLRPLEVVGFGEVDLEGATAVPLDPGEPVVPRATTPRAVVPEPTPDADVPPELAAARLDVDRLDALLGEAQASYSDALAEQKDLQTIVEQARSRLIEAQDALDDARATTDDRGREMGRLDRALQTARKKLQREEQRA